MADEFAISAARFIMKLKGTPDEVWSKLLKLRGSKMVLKESGWRELLAKLKAE